MTLGELVFQRFRNIYKGVKAFKWGINREIFYEISPNNWITQELQSKGVEISILKKERISELLEIWKIDLDQIRRRLRDGHSICFVSEKNGELLSYHWVQFKGSHFVQQAGKHIQIEEGKEFMIYHTRVKNDHQGSGINKMVLGSLIQHFFKEGYKRGLIYTNKNNLANRKGLEKMGFRISSQVSSFRWGRRYFPIAGHTI